MGIATQARKDFICRASLEWFKYDPYTGIVSWKKKPNRNIPIGRAAGFLWPVRTNTYIRICVEGIYVFAHIVAFVLQTGETPKGVVDHDDGNGTNNKWSNLNDVTQKINMRNQRLGKANSSGAMGVDFHQASLQWRARIIVDKHEHHLGVFKTMEEAVLVRKMAEREFGFNLNHGRTE